MYVLNVKSSSYTIRKRFRDQFTKWHINFKALFKKLKTRFKSINI